MSPSGNSAPSILIREMTVEDRAVWADMYAQLFPDGTRLGMLQEVDRILKAQHRAAYCAVVGDEIAGFAEYNLREFANGCHTQPVPFLEGIFVAPEHRNRGVATALIAYLEAVARRQGYRELGSNVLMNNAASIDVHKRLGFEETERVVYFRKDI